MAYNCPISSRTRVSYISERRILVRLIRCKTQTTLDLSDAHFPALGTGCTFCFKLWLAHWVIYVCCDRSNVVTLILVWRHFSSKRRNNKRILLDKFCHSYGGLRNNRIDRTSVPKRTQLRLCLLIWKPSQKRAIPQILSKMYSVHSAIELEGRMKTNHILFIPKTR